MHHKDTCNAFIGFLLAVSLTGCQPNRSYLAQEPAARSEPHDSLFQHTVEGFSHCQLDDLFIDEYSQSTTNEYLLLNEHRRCDNTEALATYCIDERFHGLHVIRLSVPRTTWPVFSMHFSDSLEHAQETLVSVLGNTFRPSAASRQGVQPELIEDPSDTTGSVLICTKTD